MLRAPREPELLIKGEQALLSIWGFIQASRRAEAAPLPVVTPCVLQPGRSRQQYFMVSPETKRGLGFGAKSPARIAAPSHNFWLQNGCPETTSLVPLGHLCWLVWGFYPRGRNLNVSV